MNDTVNDEEYALQIAHVIAMEELYDHIVMSCSQEFDVKKMKQYKKEIQKLEDYYNSGAWMEDYLAEREGRFPKDLNLGILAEDTIYDLLSDIHHLKQESQDCVDNDSTRWEMKEREKTG